MTMPTVAPPRSWTFPRHSSSILDNGLTVLSIHVPGQYVVTAEVVFDLPLSVEPRDREGIAAMCVRTMGDATRRHDSSDFAHLVESAGAAMYTLVGHSGLVLGMAVPSTRLDDGLGLLAQAVCEPALTDADVAHNVAQRLGEIEQTLAGPGRADVLFSAQVFGPECRAARMPGGSSGTVEGLTADAVREFYRDHLGPRSTTLILTGHLAEAPLDLAAVHFGRWGNTAAPQPHPVATSPAGDSVVLWHRPGAVQAEVRLGGFGIDRRDPRWGEASVAVHALGGGIGSRLSARLREELGYTYGVSMGLHPQRLGGAYVVSGSFRTEVAAAALAEARSLLDVRARPLTGQEVERSVTTISRSAASTHTTAASIAGEAAQRLLCGLPPDSIERELEAVRLATADSVTAAAVQLLGAGPGTLVVVGDADQLEPQLAAIGLTASVRESAGE